MKTRNQKSDVRHPASGLRRLSLAALLLCAFALNASAVYLQPFWYYGRDQFGLPITNAITIDAWPPTNNITANNTNLVISVPHTFIPDANGFVSNNIALGNYRVVIQGFTPGVPFSILSNASPVNISSSADIPVTTFQNFTLAQIVDAGSIAGRASNDFALASSVGPMAIRSTNDFALSTPAGITNSLAYIPANAANTNDFARATPAGVTNSLAFIPANAANTNDFARATLAGITAAQGYTSKTNDGYIGLANATGWIVTNGPVVWVYYKTNNLPGSAFTNVGAGAFMSTSNGMFLVLSNNLVWQLK
jgi:hypothetical protein